ncbi:MAG: protein kinase [Acidobacteria bacterium]|nr:protein kinase [Acidobacteriota bacterium]
MHVPSPPPAHVAPGRRLGHYDIVSPLGKGGMGEVYRARDTRLEREVAVKVLRRRFAEDETARARFEREAKAIAALSHPNILAIFDFGIDNGVPYSVTELLDGETLRARLDVAPLPWKAAVDVAAAIADGLAAAHAKQIVHRDVKPDNIFLTRDERVKILDFGLARSAEPAPTTTESPTMIETSVGTLVGTVGYMAPEQVRGLSLTPSVDLFGLGCVLFEMVTGRRAFERETPADTMSAILNDAAPTPSASGIQVPPALDRLIRFCLEKVPERRIRSARDLSAALRAVAIDSSAGAAPSLAGGRAGRTARGRTRGASPHSIAVLPFVASGDAADLDFLGEGIAESIINAVAGVKGVRVVPRTLSFRHVGREGEPRALGVELNAEVLLSGRITVRGDQLHVQADLVDTSDESQLWGSRFIRPARELSTLAPVIADDIIEAVRSRFDVQLTRARAPRAPRAKAPTPSEAYREYLRGRHQWNKWTASGFRASVDAFARAIDLDPSFALAHAGLADAYGAMAYYAHMPAADALPLARHAAHRAVELDPQLAEAHATLGIAAMFFDWNWVEAERRLTQAIALNDRSLTARVYYSLFLTCRGRLYEGLDAARQAERLDPMSLLAMSGVAWSLMHTGDIEATEAQVHRMMSVAPDFPDALAMLAHIAEGRRDVERALAYLRRWFPQVGIPESAVEALRRAHAAEGWTGYWRAYLGALDLQRGPGCIASSVYAAALHAMLGEPVAALDDLERARDARAPGLTFIGVDLRLGTLRGMPRFDALLAQLGLA